ncbi:hypothetical protein [Murinocardiopsis flavida]|nr:hypothetical protein [Murinocardiopsis flavida]
MPPGPPPNKGNGGVIALVIILVVVVLGGGGIAGWFLLSGGDSSSASSDPTPSESSDAPVDDPIDDPSDDSGGSGSSGGTIPDNFAGTHSGTLTATRPDGTEEEWIIGISMTEGTDTGAIAATVDGNECAWDLTMTSASDTEMNMDYAYSDYGDSGGICQDPGTVTITDDGGMEIEINSKGTDGTTTAEGSLD